MLEPDEVVIFAVVLAIITLAVLIAARAMGLWG